MIAVKSSAVNRCNGNSSAKGASMTDINGLKKAKKEIDTEENVVAFYDKYKPVISGVLSVIPYLGSFIDGFVEQKLSNYQTRKRQLFVDAILANKCLITSEKVRNEAFIINTAKIIELVDRTTSDDKVIYYGNLIRNGYLDSGEQISNDDFEEYVSILKDLSEREIKYLVAFADEARKNNYGLQGEKLKLYYDRMLRLFPRIKPEVILNRLKRTGFVIDQMASTGFENEGKGNDIDDEGTSVLFGSGYSYTLEHSYDEFEKIVLRTYDSGKRAYINAVE